MYKNGSLVGAWDVSSWGYNANGGYIGIWTLDGDQAWYDDFGGGTLSGAYVPSGKVLAAQVAAPTVRLNAKPRQAGVQRTAALLTPPEGVIWRCYYYTGAARIALREDSATESEVYYILTDHLGSTSLTYRQSDGQVTTQKYKPWGELRPGPTSSLPFDRTFQGQRDSGWGLKRCWYDSYLNSIRK